MDINIGLLLAFVGLLGLGGGKIWGTKSVETKFLPRVEHDLGCENVKLKGTAALNAMKEEIIEAIRANGNCSTCERDSTHTTQ
jgi:hypothetical protein